MKKTPFSLLLFTIGTLGLFSMASCSDDDDDSKDYCTCTLTFDDGVKETEKIDKEEMMEWYGTTSCSKIQQYLYEEMEDEVEKVSCK